MIDRIQPSRREFVSQLGAGFGSIAMAQQLLAEASDEHLHHRPRAKAVIQLIMNGGPFQGDMFDPKPALNKHEGQRPDEVDFRTERKTGGLLGCPFKFMPRGNSGLPVSELLPRLSRHIDDMSILRSVYTDNPNHGPALLMLNNGTITPTVPSLGSWLMYGLGSENSNLPGYIVLCPGRPVRFSILWTSAFLPPQHSGTYVNHSTIDPEKMIPYLSNKSGSLSQQRRQLDLVKSLNDSRRNAKGSNAILDARIDAMETAFRMQTSASQAFDIGLETKECRAEYGEGHFANGCLLARRLVERGVRFVQVYYGNGQPWDTHEGHNDKVPELCRSIDGPIDALLTDLKRRGLFDDTVVVWGGEFGRTPVSENGNGRDHNHYGMTMWMAGGGVRGGYAHGATDDFGFRAVQDRVHMHDLHATVLHLLGIDHERLTYRYAGRDFRLTDVAGNVIDDVIA